MDSRTLPSRVLMTACCVVWVFVWIHLLTQMGVVTRTLPYVLLIVALAATRLTTPRWTHPLLGVMLMLLAAMTVAGGFQHGLGGINDWFHGVVTTFAKALTTHALAPDLTKIGMATLLSLLFALITYASYFTRLWLFYQGLALFALLVVGLTTGVVVLLDVMAVAVAAVIGVSVHGMAKAGIALSAGQWSRTLLPVVGLCGVAWLGVSVGPQWNVTRPGWFSQVWNDVVTRLAFQSNLNTPAPIQTVRPELNNVGFSTGAQPLGGSVAPDYDPVLGVIEPHATVLRGQVLTDYTGTAWVPGHAALVPPQARSALSLSGRLQGVTSQRMVQTVHVLGAGLRSNVFLGAYSIASIHVTKSSASLHVAVDPSADVWQVQPALATGTAYQVTSVVPTHLMASLQHGQPPVSSVLASVQTPALAPDLQLPSSFPKRDIQLAHAITLHAASEYQMAQSILQYLDAHESYATTDIPVPTPSQDFVDQFLFQTHRGYCNHFSTSMAVLLRAVGIPTRWVTGFLPGTRDLTYTGRDERFVIRDADAHSWVEVYFPNVGWVPFDPTPARGTQSLGGVGGSTAPVRSTPTKPTSPSLPKPPQTQPSSTQHHHRASSIGIHSAIGWVVGGASLAVLLILAETLRRRQRRDQFDIAQERTKQTGASSQPDRDEPSIRAVSDLVTRLLAGSGVNPSGTTFRQLADPAVRMGVDASEFEQFVQLSEKLWYSREPLSDADRNRLLDFRERWLVGESTGIRT